MLTMAGIKTAILIDTSRYKCMVMLSSFIMRLDIHLQQHAMILVVRSLFENDG